MARGEQITVADLQLDAPPEQKSRKQTRELDFSRSFRDLKRLAVEAFERDYVRELLARSRGNLAAAARQARMDRKNVWALAKRYGLDLDEFRKRDSDS